MKGNNIYNCFGVLVALPGANDSLSFQPVIETSQFFIKKIVFDFSLEVGVNQFVPVENMINQNVILDVGFNSITPNFRTFNFVAGTAFAGSKLQMFRPGTYDFDSMFIQNSVLFQLTILNYDLMNNAELRYSVTAEIEML